MGVLFDIPPYHWWDVVLIDEYDQAHEYRVFARSRNRAIVGAYDEALAKKFHTANSWELRSVDQSAR